MTRTVPPILRHTYVAVLLLWVAMPFALGGRVAQDAIPYVVAGKVARSQPADVYAARNGSLFDLQPSFRERWCRAAPAGTDCDSLAVAFVAAPPVIPVTIALTVFGDRGATLLMQIAAGAMLAGGMWILWRRLAHRTRRAPMMLVASVLAFTPMAMVPIGLGQTSPILFLSVCLGLGTRTARSSFGRAAVWAAAVALKVFPAALVLMVVWLRRHRMLVWATALLAALSLATLALVDPSVWRGFIRSTLDLNAHTSVNPYNGAINAFVIRLAGSSTSTAVALAGRAVAVVVAAAVCWFGMRRTDEDTRWAAGYLALLVLTPLVWWHYTWVVIGAIGVGVGAQRRLTDRMVAIFPIAAFASVAPSIPNANGHSWPMVQSILLLAGAATFCWLAWRSRTQVAGEIGLGPSR